MPTVKFQMRIQESQVWPPWWTPRAVGLARPGWCLGLVSSLLDFAMHGADKLQNETKDREKSESLPATETGLARIQRAIVRV